MTDPTSTTTWQSKFPADTAPYYQDLLYNAQQVASMPYAPYNNARLAGFTPDEMMAQSGIRAFGTAGAPNQLTEGTNFAYTTGGNLANLYKQMGLEGQGAWQGITSLANQYPLLGQIGQQAGALGGANAMGIMGTMQGYANPALTNAGSAAANMFGYGANASTLGGQYRDVFGGLGGLYQNQQFDAANQIGLQGAANAGNVAGLFSGLAPQAASVAGNAVAGFGGTGAAATALGQQGQTGVNQIGSTFQNQQYTGAGNIAGQAATGAQSLQGQMSGMAPTLQGLGTSYASQIAGAGNQAGTLGLGSMGTLQGLGGLYGSDIYGKAANVANQGAARATSVSDTITGDLWNRYLGQSNTRNAQFGDIADLYASGPGSLYQQAQGIGQGGAGRLGQIAEGAQNVGGFLDADVSRYMDPYLQNVLAAQEREAINAGDRQMANLKAQAASQGALGGYRHGLLEGDIQKGVRQEVMDLRDRGLSQAYGDAQRMFEADRAAQFQGLQQQLAAQQASEEALRYGQGAQGEALQGRMGALDQGVTTDQFALSGLAGLLNTKLQAEAQAQAAREYGVNTQADTIGQRLAAEQAAYQTGASGLQDKMAGLGQALSGAQTGYGQSLDAYRAALEASGQAGQMGLAGVEAQNQALMSALAAQQAGYDMRMGGYDRDLQAQQAALAARQMGLDQQSQAYQNMLGAYGQMDASRQFGYGAQNQALQGALGAQQAGYDAAAGGLDRYLQGQQVGYGTQQAGLGQAAQMQQAALAASGQADANRQFGFTSQAQALQNQIAAAQAAEGALSGYRGQQLQSMQGLSALVPQLANLGGMEQALTLERLNALANMGQQQRALQQAGMDTGYQDFMNQRQYPQQQLGWMSQILQGLPINPTTTQTTYQQQPGLFQSMLGAGLGGLGLYNAIQSKG